MLETDHLTDDITVELFQHRRHFRWPAMLQITNLPLCNLAHVIYS
jgi:hypothetical protein